MHVLPARRHPGDESGAADKQPGDRGAGEDQEGKVAGSSFKSQREAQRKADAGNRWDSVQLGCLALGISNFILGRRWGP